MLTAGCRPDQVGQWLFWRGVTVSSDQAVAVANVGADHQARTTGTRGTCTPTGIFYAESGGNWTAQNRSSTASGGYQYLDSTWAGHRGYVKARHAPPWVQWERFGQTWAGGAGRSHWAANPVC